MAPIGGDQQEDKGVGEIAADLWQLLRDYAKQETIDPLKAMGRFLGYGLGAALSMGLGILFGAVAVIRALQTETGAHLTGSWNWVPYVAGLAFTSVAVAISVSAIKRPIRAEEKQR